MVIPNRYYEPQTFYFEDDAVIQAQPSGYQVMDVNPPFNITRNAAGNTTVTTTLLQLYGNASTVVGLGSQEVYSHFRYSQSISASGPAVAANKSTMPFTFKFQIGTQFPCAWATFLKQAVANSGIGSRNATIAYTPSTFTPVASSCTSQNGATTVITLTISNVNYAQYYYAGVQVTMGVGGT